ncbi:hypothetical protein [Rhizobium rhizogenes]|uniref:hypothetical protein n=1 Tax=Rhizobium rhizogenes TaxID=359 RepID=UPI001574DF0C|nr:hypothetical protein [Rhizobium rhizogenes]NTI78405.1 hypothetical protein [Rhizobium rhizogenes]
MIVPNLPWIIGPVPILATIWSAYDYSKAILRREMTGGAHIASALLLPLGVISLLLHLFFSSHGFIVLSIFTQVSTAISYFILIYILNYISIGRFFYKKYFFGAYVSVKSCAVCIAILIALNVASYLTDDGSACTIGKCFAIEYIFGVKMEMFSRLYLNGIVGSFFAFGFMMSIYSLFTSIKK